MTKITFYRNDQKEFVGFRSEGHSGYAEAGEDIVCAAISVLVINTINSIMEFTGTQIGVDMDEEMAYIDVSFYNKPDSGAELLVRSLILGLQSIAEDEEKKEFVNLIFEEV